MTNRVGSKRRFALGLLLALVLGVAGWVGSARLRLPSPSPLPSLTASAEDTVWGDPRVRAFVEAYRPLIDSVTYGEEDVVFSVGTRPIHFLDGRMLEEGRLDRVKDCDSIFYSYSLEPLTEPPPLAEEASTSCTDVLESLWGRTETEIRMNGQSTTFLGHRLFVNSLLVDALAAVERDMLEAATDDGSVNDWIDEINITYSFIDREIAGSLTRSYHAFGLAVDFEPNSYQGLQAYWRWSRVFNREEWHLIPLEQRWSPPQAVVEIFERHGFVWGGKWPRFDVVHFEYRPEILLYNRLISSGRE